VRALVKSPLVTVFLKSLPVSSESRLLLSELNRLPSRIDEHEGCKSPESMSYWSQKKKYKAWKWEDISRPRRLIIDLDDSFSSENTE
jgi:hypothetical protein